MEQGSDEPHTDGARVRGWYALPSTLWSFTAGSRRELHLAVIACFAEAAFDPAINLEAISARVESLAPELGDDALLLDVLRQMTDEWGLLEESRDESATYRSPDEFRRRSRQWQMTAAGQAALAGLDAAAAAFESYAALQPAALDDLADTLTAVVAEVTSPQPDAAAVHLRLAAAENGHRALVDNLRTFIRDVNRLLSRVDASDQDITKAKTAIIDYLSRYVVDVERPAARVAEAVARVGDAGVDAIVQLAVEGSNIAPGVGNDDPHSRAVAQRTQALRAILEWFAPGGAGTFAMLLPRGRDAILRFMRMLELRREQRRRAASLPDDLRAVARAMSAADSTEACHRIWVAATGLGPARHHHRSVDADDGPLDAGAPVADNPRVPVTVELRRSARSSGRPGRGDPVPDARAVRAARQQAQAAELATLLARRAVLHHPDGVWLSDLEVLDDDVFGDLLDLLATALAVTPDADGRRTAVSTDGAVHVALWPIDGRRGTATVRCGRGTLRGPNLLVAIELRGQVVTPSAAGTIAPMPERVPS